MVKYFVMLMLVYASVLTTAGTSSGGTLGDERRNSQSPATESLKVVANLDTPVRRTK